MCYGPAPSYVTADVTIIGSHTWELLGSPTLRPTADVHGYGGDFIDASNESDVTVTLAGTTLTTNRRFSQEQCITVSKTGWSLLTLALFLLALPSSSHTVSGAPLPGVNNVAVDPDAEAVKEELYTLFNSKFGTVQKVLVRFELEPSAQPKIFKARSVPIALKISTFAEIDRLVANNDVLEPVNPMETPIEWASPLVRYRYQEKWPRLCPCGFQGNDQPLRY